MRWNFVLFVSLLATQSLSALADDFLGEGLFFGRNTRFSQVEGEEGNLVQDEYGDVRVVLCSPDNWVISVDPNRCGYASSIGMPCTEMPEVIRGPYSQTFARGNHYLVNRNSGEFLTIESIGESKYSFTPLSGMNPVVVWLAEKPLTSQELSSYCD